MLLDQCELPVVGAPLAGGPSTPELCAAVCEAGGFGILAAGYLPAVELASRIEQTRTLTRRPFGVNLFVPSTANDAGAATAAAAVAAYAEVLRPEAQRAGVALGEPRHDDDDWSAKLALLARSPVALVSFTFGCPTPQVIADLQRAGSEAWVTVTTVDEARTAENAGAEGLVVQGAEAGGHRGGFTDSVEPVALLALLQLVRATTRLPLIAGGGIMTGSGLAAVLAAGARAGALGTALLRTPEAGTSDVQRTAIDSDEPTVLTRAFTGRLARGIRNRFLEEYSAVAPQAYPQIHYLTAPLRANGRSVGDPDVVNLWAGQAHALATDEPAGDVVRRIAEEARAVLDDAQRRFKRG